MEIPKSTQASPWYYVAHEKKLKVGGYSNIKKTSSLSFLIFVGNKGILYVMRELLNLKYHTESRSS